MEERSNMAQTRYKCYFLEIGHMRGMEDAQMTTLEISPNFTLFWGHIGAKTGVKMGKNVPISQ